MLTTSISTETVRSLYKERVSTDDCLSKNFINLVYGLLSKPGREIRTTGCKNKISNLEQRQSYYGRPRQPKFTREFAGFSTKQFKVKRSSKMHYFTNVMFEVQTRQTHFDMVIIFSTMQYNMNLFKIEVTLTSSLQGHVHRPELFMISGWCLCLVVSGGWRPNRWRYHHQTLGISKRTPTTGKTGIRDDVTKPEVTSHYLE